MNNKGKITDLNKEILHKFFHQKCNSSERESVINCLSDPGCEKKLKYIIQDHWNEIESIPPGNDIDSGRTLSNIHQQIRMNEWMKSQSRPFYRKIYVGFSKIAAILMLPVLVFSGWYFLKNSNILRADDKIAYAEIYSPLGARTTFELPDGSSGWLNSGSTLKFPHKFQGQKRKVILRGEGYFDIAENPKKPFVVEVVVEAGRFEVVALGTSFNVKHYANEASTDITLNKGNILVNRILQNNKVNSISLKPNQQLTIHNKSYEFQKRDVDANRISSWKDGKLIFRNEPMTEVIKIIERWYNVELILKDKELENYRYRATFMDETLDEVLRMIKLTSPVDFTEADRIKLPDGSFTKKSITLFIKPGYKNTIL